MSFFIFFFGFLSGFAFTVFLALFVLNYTQIEERKKQEANVVKFRDQNNNREPNTSNDLHKSGDTE